MPKHGQNISAEKRREIYQALADGNESATKIARHLDVGRGAVYNCRRQLILAGFRVLTDAPAEAPPTPEPVEVHDAAFWRSRARELEKAQGRMARVIEELGGIRNVPVRLPKWAAPVDTGRKGNAVIGCLISDIHDGEVISAEEINGVNEFNPDICEARLKRYFDAACIIGHRWAGDCRLQGALLSLAGDLISGDIHEELMWTNALTAHEQVQHVTGVLAAGLTQLLDAYGTVHVVGVPGNHGRSTRKPTAKMYSRLSYDTLVVSMLAERFRDDKRVTFQCTAAKDQSTPIFGRSVYTTHFDKIGTRGGQGFAGPMLPIVRGAKKILEQQGSVSRWPALIQGGHYHSTGNPYIGSIPILANGSIPGVSEYSDDLRVAVEPPQQWLYLLHSKRWLRERMPVVLTDVITPDRPRVRVPVQMG